jgi:hypothetical protein
MIVIMAGAVVVEGSGRVGPGAKTRVRVGDAVARPAQFHAQRSRASREGESEAHGQQIRSWGSRMGGGCAEVETAVK